MFGNTTRKKEFESDLYRALRIKSLLSNTHGKLGIGVYDALKYEKSGEWISSKPNDYHIYFSIYTSEYILLHRYLEAVTFEERAHYAQSCIKSLFRDESTHDCFLKESLEEDIDLIDYLYWCAGYRHEADSMFVFSFPFICKYVRGADLEKLVKKVNQTTPLQYLAPDKHRSNSHYTFYMCRCGISLRVPAGHTKIEVTCPKCHQKFYAYS